MNKEDYPICPRCGNIMYPIWFIDEEEKLDDVGHLCKTGRVRKSLSHFECCSCGKKQNVDDSFDGQWYYK